MAKKKLEWKRMRRICLIIWIIAFITQQFQIAVAAAFVGLMTYFVEWRIDGVNRKQIKTG